MNEACFYKKKSYKRVRCELCPHLCELKKNEMGLCQVRKNISGKLYALNYGKLIRTKVEKIENLGLKYFESGSKTLAVATVGCNLRCAYCNTFDIAIEKVNPIRGRSLTPKQVVKTAIANGCQSISYALTEPTIFYEYVYDISKEAHKKNLRNVFVTNGFISPKPLKKILPFLDAIKVDLKGFNKENYKFVFRGELDPVLKALKIISQSGKWLEISTPIIPRGNTDIQELEKLIRFIQSLKKNIPWQIKKLSPTYNMENRKAPSVNLLKKVYDLSRKLGMKYSYIQD